jgi:hypothetical protein
VLLRLAGTYRQQSAASPRHCPSPQQCLHYMQHPIKMCVQPPALLLH